MLLLLSMALIKSRWPALGFLCAIFETLLTRRAARWIGAFLRTLRVLPRHNRSPGKTSCAACTVRGDQHINAFIIRAPLWLSAPACTPRQMQSKKVIVAAARRADRAAARRAPLPAVASAHSRAQPSQLQLA